MFIQLDSIIILGHFKSHSFIICFIMNYFRYFIIFINIESNNRPADVMTQILNVEILSDFASKR